MQENQKIFIKKLIKEVNSTCYKQIDVALPCTTKNLVSAAIDKAEIKVIQGTSNLKLKILFILHINYCEEMTLSVKSFKKVLEFEHYITLSKLKDEFFRVSLEPSSILQLELISSQVISVQLRLSFVTMIIQRELVPLNEILSEDGQIHVCSTPDGRYDIVNNVGTMKIEIN